MLDKITLFFDSPLITINKLIVSNFGIEHDLHLMRNVKIAYLKIIFTDTVDIIN